MNFSSCIAEKPQVNPKHYSWKELIQKEGIYKLVSESSYDNEYIRFIVMKNESGTTYCIWVNLEFGAIEPADYVHANKTFIKVEENLRLSIV